MLIENGELFSRFGVALFIGLLVGLQREYSYDAEQKPEEVTAAGLRTFALLGLLGATAAFAAERMGSAWPFVAIVVMLGSMLAIAYYQTAVHGSIGMTTEVAGFMVILAGAVAYWQQLTLAVALGVVTTSLLSFKLELHTFARRLTREDIVAALKFALITAIVLPVLPNEPISTTPPFDVLNLYKIWLMVVLISAISFLGYGLIKLVGSRQGIGLTGLLGGLVSSTAVTLSFSQRSQKHSQMAKPFALAIMVAWTVMFARVLLEVATVNWPLLLQLWLPIVAAAVAGLVYCGYLYLAPQGDEQEEVTVANPFELGPAITFGLMYGAILLVGRAAQYYLGDVGVYASSILSGLVDVDAITLSVSELNRGGNLADQTAVRAIVLAAMSNTVVKGGIVLTSGSPSLRRVFLPGFLLILITGTTVAFFR